MGSACLPCLMRVLLLAGSLQGCVLCIVFQHCYNSNGKWAEGLSGQNRSRCQTFSYRLPCSSCSREVLFEHSFARRMERGKKQGGDRKRASPGSAQLSLRFGRDTFALQVTPAGFVLVCRPPRGVPEKPNAFFFKTLQLKMF